MFLKPILPHTPQYKEGWRDGAENMFAEVEPILLRCVEVLEIFSKCLSAEGDRCAPNMEDFVAGFDASESIIEFIEEFNSEFKRGY